MYSIFENNEGDQHYNAALTDKESSSSADIQTVSSNLDQETVIDTCQVDLNLDNSCVVNLNFVSNTPSDVNRDSLTEIGDNVETSLDTLVFNPNAKIVLAENSNRQMENDDNISDNTAQDNLDNQMYISQRSESNAIPLPRRTLVDVVKAHYYKVLLALTVCCIITLCAMPIILYYVNQTRNNATMDLEYLHEKNTSIKVCSYAMHA